MDGVDGDDAAFAKACEGAEDDGSAGSEGDGAVELDGWLVVFCAYPFCSEGFGLLAVVFAAGGDEDVAVPVAEDFDGLRGGGTEAEEADSLAGLGAGYAQAAEADDAGAEERGDVGVVEAGGQGEDEVGADEGVLGVAAVDGVAGEGGVVAEVFFVAETEGAGAVGSADPGDADAGACVSAFDDLAYDLVAEDEGFLDEGEVAFEDVEVGAADSAGEDSEEDVVRGERRSGDVFDFERLVGGVKDGGFHLGSSREKFSTTIFDACWLDEFGCRF